MLANELAKPVANLRAAVVSVAIGRLRRKLLRLSGGLRRLREGSDFLNRTDADAVGFAERAVDSSGFCHAHFSAVDGNETLEGSASPWPTKPLHVRDV
jgi:hypothetical protein